MLVLCKISPLSLALVGYVPSLHALLRGMQVLGQLNFPGHKLILTKIILQLLGKPVVLGTFCVRKSTKVKTLLYLEGESLQYDGGTCLFPSFLFFICMASTWAIN